MQTGRILVASLLVWAGSVAAQTVTLAPSAAVACLTPPLEQRGDVEYPFYELKTRVKGRVKVEARFTSADRPPELSVLESEGGDAFVAAVKTAMRHWRVPCLPRGGPEARLLQEFVFKPDDRRVSWGPAGDARDPERRKLLSCLLHQSGRRSLPYPPDAAGSDIQGRVLAKLRFEAADQPPKAEVISRPSARPLKKAAERWVRGYRLPCLADEPVEVEIIFLYVIQGQARGFKPLSLEWLLARAKRAPETTLTLDTTTMGCPFELKLRYFQPYARNSVGMVGDFEATREPLLRHLADFELDLDDWSLDAVFADDTTITVPCIKIDLKPKEKS